MKPTVLFVVRSPGIGGGERGVVALYERFSKRHYNKELVTFVPDTRRIFRPGLFTVVPEQEFAAYVCRVRPAVVFADRASVLAAAKTVKGVRCLNYVYFTENYNEGADANIVCSKTDWLKLRLLRGASLPPLVCYLPVDAKRYAALARPKRDGPIVLGRMARAEPSKWDYLLIATLRECAASDVDVRFVFVGLPRIYRWRIRLLPRRVRERVTILPELKSDEQKATFFNQCDLTWQISEIGESFGVVIAESFAFGRPVMTDGKFFAESGRVNPAKYDTQIELVDHEMTGWYANYPSTVLKLLRRLTRPEARRLGTTATRKCRRLYDSSRSARTLEAIMRGDARRVPSAAELASYQKEYFSRVACFAAINAEVPAAQRRRFERRKRGWRVIVYCYLVVRKVLRTVGIDLEEDP